MLAAMLVFDLDQSASRRWASDVTHAMAVWRGVDGLRTATYWHDVVNRRGGAMHLWASRREAVDFYDEGFLQRCEDLFGQRPTLAFVEVTATVPMPRPVRTCGASSGGHGIR